MKRHPIIVVVTTHRRITGRLLSSMFRRRAESLGGRIGLPAVQRRRRRRRAMVIDVVGVGTPRPAGEGAWPAAQRRVLGGRRRRQAVVDEAPVAGGAATQKVAEDAPEAMSKQTVDDEVGRRVDDDQQVAEVRRVDERVGAVLVLRLLDRLEDSEYAVRSMAQHDDHDDDDDDVRYVLLLRTDSSSNADFSLILTSY